MIVDAQAYGRFVAALPKHLEVDLMDSTNISTLFFQALSKGWTEEQITEDMLSFVGLGIGVKAGLVYTRLTKMNSLEPLDRSRRRNTLPGAPALPDPISPEWSRERKALLIQIRDEHLSEDTAEWMMRTLITAQRSREEMTQD